VVATQPRRVSETSARGQKIRVQFAGPIHWTACYLGGPWFFPRPAPPCWRKCFDPLAVWTLHQFPADGAGTSGLEEILLTGGKPYALSTDRHQSNQIKDPGKKDTPSTPHSLMTFEYYVEWDLVRRNLLPGGCR